MKVSAPVDRPRKQSTGDAFYHWGGLLGLIALRQESDGKGEQR
jgi:hypothetical protein